LLWKLFHLLITCVSRLSYDHLFSLLIEKLYTQCVWKVPQLNFCSQHTNRAVARTTKAVANFSTFVHSCLELCSAAYGVFALLCTSLRHATKKRNINVRVRLHTSFVETYYNDTASTRWIRTESAHTATFSSWKVVDGFALCSSSSDDSRPSLNRLHRVCVCVVVWDAASTPNVYLIISFYKRSFRFYSDKRFAFFCENVKIVYTRYH